MKRSYSKIIKIFGKEYSEGFYKIPDEKKYIQIKGYPPINFLITEYYKLGYKLKAAKFETDVLGVSSLGWEEVDETSIVQDKYNEFYHFKGNKIIKKLLKKNGEVTE